MAVACLLSWATGCNSEPDIRSYVVPRSSNSSPFPSMAQGGSGAEANATPVERRMLAAILPAGSRAWFLKLVGPPEAITQIQTGFEKVLSTFKSTDGGEATWELPEGWTNTPGNGIRYATILVAQSGGDPLALTVTQLPVNDTSWTAYCESNVNRWRRELSLPEEKWEQMSGYAKPVAGGNEQTPAYSVDLTGKQVPNAGMRGPMAGPFSGGAAPPFASGNAPVVPSNPSASTTGSVPPGEPAASPLKYELPAGWQARGASGMRWGTFIVGDAETHAEVTVIPASGDLESNVRRWQEQLTPTVDEAALKSSLDQAEHVQVDGQDVTIVSLTDGKDDGEAILAAIIPMEQGSSLFVKYKGNAQLAKTEKANFSSFVKSLRWK